MKLGLGLYRALLAPEHVRFAKQAGATHIVAHIPGQFTRQKDKIITSDNAKAGFGLSEADDPIWTDEGLADLKAMINAEGLELEALENFAPAHWYDVLLDGPRRTEQMAHLKRIVRTMGRLGIGTLRAAAPGRLASTTRCKRRSRPAWFGTWSMTPLALSRITQRRRWARSALKRFGDALPTSCRR
jgi:hypothetical protein